MDKINMGKINIIGINTTADNFENLMKVHELWDDFFRNNIYEKITSKVDNKIYAVYTDFESNEKGKYNFILGCMVKDISFIPDGMILKEIKPSNYSVFKEKGNVKLKLPEMWQRIWNTKLNRKFIADFEIYNMENIMFDKADIEILIGIEWFKFHLKAKLSLNLPSAKYYIDAVDSYSSNENAVNWNASLVYALSYLIK